MNENAGTPERRDQRHLESLRLRTLSVGITASDLDASVAWYRDVVGFTVKDTWEHDGKVMGVSLVAGAVQIIVNQDDWAKGRDRQKAVGIGVYASTAQDVDTLAANIKARGGTLASEPADMPWGTRAFIVVDPDGVRLTIASEV